MAKHLNSEGIPLPRAWPKSVKSAMLQVISLAQYAAALTRGWAVNSPIVRMRLRAESERLCEQVAFLKEEIRIKDARMRRIGPCKRRHYAPAERLSILELRAARAWSVRRAADVFQVTPATITSWMKRLDEHGPNVLVQIREPVNKFPEFVRYAVQRLKTLCPSLEKVKMAEILCRAGLHLGSTTVGRILKESPRPPWQDAERSLLPLATGQRTSTHRTAQALAAKRVLRWTSHAHCRTARRSIRARGQVSGWQTSSADRLAQSSSVGQRTPGSTYVLTRRVR